MIKYGVEKEDSTENIGSELYILCPKCGAYQKNISNNIEKYVCANCQKQFNTEYEFNKITEIDC